MSGNDVSGLEDKVKVLSDYVTSTMAAVGASIIAGGSWYLLRLDGAAVIGAWAIAFFVILYFSRRRLRAL